MKKPGEEQAARRLAALLAAVRDPVAELAMLQCECRGVDADCMLSNLVRAAETFISAVVRALEGPPEGATGTPSTTGEAPPLNRTPKTGTG